MLGKFFTLISVASLITCVIAAILLRRSWYALDEIDFSNGTQLFYVKSYYGRIKIRREHAEGRTFERFINRSRWPLNETILTQYEDHPSFPHPDFIYSAQYVDNDLIVDQCIIPYWLVLTSCAAA